MDLQDSSLDREYERLNDAIMKAIVSSKDVENVLQDFKGKKMVNDLAVLNLVLSLEELYDMVFSDPDTQDNFAFEPVAEDDLSTHEKETTSIGKMPNERAVEGQKLTANEILFEKFLQRNFDEKKWMKKLRIKL